jgi:hypothetical protein
MSWDPSGTVVIDHSDTEFGKLEVLPEDVIIDWHHVPLEYTVKILRFSLSGPSFSVLLADVGVCRSLIDQLSDAPQSPLANHAGKPGPPAVL